ncbi:MAG: sulfotransferase [Gammaproteobacteria bacterium]|nr:sulfotransferase [Gammaproteobacteria bacterium]
MTAAPPPAWLRDTLREGYGLLARGDFRGAAARCQRLLQAKPDLVEAHFLVGLIAQESGDTRTALHGFGSVTTLDATHGAAWAQLARLYMRLGHVRRADDALERAVAHQDGNPVVQDLIANTFSLLGEQDRAAEWLERAVAARPEHVPFLVDLANNQMFRGQLEEAQRTVRRALTQRPDNANAHWLLANLRRATDRSHVEELQRLLAAPDLADRSRAFLAYGLGKELEDLEDWDAAFEAFADGARARRRTLRFDEQAEIETFAALAETLTERWLAGAGEGDPDPSPIFVIGQPRTGTTLVERIIASHSAVHSAGELRQFGSCLRRLADYQGERRDSAALIRAAAAIEPRRLGAAYLMTTERLRGSLPRFVDKLPTNYRYLPLILAALPAARIVHLRRNPMDACFASFKQLFADAYPHSYDQQEMARHHARYLELMSTWRSRFGDRFLEVDYERVAAEPEPEARRIIEFLGLPWEDACLEFHASRDAVTTASAVQVREPAHTRSIGRWRRYQRQLEPMREALAASGVELLT